MATVGAVGLDPATGYMLFDGLRDPPQNLRAAVHRDWLESASAGAEIALENLAGYARGNLIYGAGSDWAALTIGTNGYILGSDGTDVLWSSIHLDEHAPTGFPNRADTSISFDDGTRTLTLAKTGASFDVYVKGVKYTYTENQTKQITDTEGTWWFYIDSAGALDAAQTTPNLRDTAWVAIVYWNATGNVALDIAEERHGMTMDGSTHALMHFTVGTRFESGLAAGDYTTAGDGSADADAQLSIGDGRIDDEDLAVIIIDDSPQNLAPIAYIPVYYLDGAAPVWRKTTADVFPLYDNATDEISYNLDTAGTWSQPAATNNYFVAMWIFATTNTVEPVVAILGQRQDSKLNDAQDNNTYEALTFDTLPFQEMKIIYRLIFQTRYPQYANTPHAKLVDIVDLRTVSNLPSGTYVATAHSSLTGRDARNSHPASAIRVDLTNMDHFLSSLVVDTTDDVQAALELLDEIFYGARTVNGDWTWSNNFKILFYDSAIWAYSPADTILELSADGHVRIGSSAQGHLTGTADSLLVSGKFEVDSTAYFDSSVELYNQVTIYNATNSRFQFYETAVGDGLVAEMRYDTDQALLAVGAPLGRQIIVSDAANYTKDYDHAVQTNPTLYVHSATDPDSAADEWWSITHDVTDAVYAVGSGVHKFTGDMLSHGSAKHYFDAGAAAGGEWIESPADTIGRMVASAYWQVGTGTPTHLAGTANSFHVSGKSEFDGAAWFDDEIQMWHSTAVYLRAYDSDTSALGAGWSARFDIAQTVLFSQDDTGRQVIIASDSYWRDFDHALGTHPLVYFQDDRNPDVSNNAFGYAGHDGTGFVIGSGPNVGAGSVPATIDNYISFAPRGTESFLLTGGGDAFFYGILNIFDNADAASVQLQTLEGDRATFTDDDEIYQSWKLSNDAGQQTEFGRITAVATDVSDGTEDGALAFDVMVDGALTEVFRADATFATNWTGLTDAGETALHSHAAAAPSAHEIASAGGFHTAAGLTIGHVLRASAADAFAFAAIAAGDLPTGIDAAKIGDGSVSNAEFELLDDYNTIGLAALTSAEVDQLENIAATTISEAQWAYLGALDQALTQASSPTFAALTVNGNITVTGTVDGVDVAVLKTDFDAHDGAVEKTAGEIVNNSAALQDDDELLFAMLANETYVFEFLLYVSLDGGPAAGIQVAINGPAAPGNVWAWVQFSSPFGAGPLTGDSAWITAYEDAEAESITGGESLACRISGSVENGGNAGNLVLRWAQDAAVENNTRILQGSYVVWHKV